MEQIEDRQSRLRVNAERQFLNKIGADCSQPVASHATIEAGQLRLRSFLGNEETNQVIFDDRTGPDAELLGEEAANTFLDKIS